MYGEKVFKNVPIFPYVAPIVVKDDGSSQATVIGDQDVCRRAKQLGLDAKIFNFE